MGEQIVEENTTTQPTVNANDGGQTINNDAQSPQDQFFNFYQDDHGNPTYSNTASNDMENDREIEDEILAANISLDAESTDNGSSMSGTTCCFICLLILIAIALILAGVGLNY